MLRRKHHNIYFSRPFFRVFPVGFFATSTPLEDRGRALAQGINVWDKKPEPHNPKITWDIYHGFWIFGGLFSGAIGQCFKCFRESDIPFHM